MSYLFPGQYNVKTHHGMYLSVHPDGKITQAPRTQDWEKITVQDLPNGKYALRTAHGKFACWANDHWEARDAVGEWETFEIKPHPKQHGKFLIASPHCHKLVNALPGNDGATFGTATEPNEWEAFEFIPLPGTQQVRPGKYFIKTHHNTYVCAQVDKVVQTPRTQDWEKIDIQRVDGQNNYALRTHHGKVACWANDHFEMRDNVGDWEKFEIKSHPRFAGKWTIGSPHFKKLINAQPGGEGATFHPADNANEWEAFELVPTH